jgi:hypothetical protein
MSPAKAKSSFNRLYEPYDLNVAHKSKLFQITQSKEQVIREYDWNNLPEWFTQKWHVDFFPITRDYIEAKYVWHKLQGNNVVANQYALVDYPERLVKNLSEPPFWFSIYKQWFIKYNDNGELVVRITLDNPDSLLGIGIFTKRGNTDG